MNKFDLVVFDMAGTTVRDLNEVETCFLKAAELTGLYAPNERIVSMMGWSKRLVFETLWSEQMKGANKEDIERKIYNSYNSFCSILENHYSMNPVLPVEGCISVFDELKRKGIKIGLTTGFYRKVTDIILTRLGWEKGLNKEYLQTENGHIDCSVSSDQVSLGRPAPFMIYKTMEKLQITNVKRVINIGDTPSDLQSGHNASVGLNLGVSYGTHSCEQLKNLPNDSIIDSIEQLLDFI